MREFSERKVYEFENFRLDADALLLFRDGEQLTLTPKVVATLLALVERNGEVVTKDDLMEAVWPDTQVEEGNLTQNLYILRKTLGNRASGNPFIETLRRRGYRFSADVSTSAATSAKQERAVPTVVVERTENIYSVVDWRKGDGERSPEVAETPATSSISYKGVYLILAVLVVASLGIAALAIFRSTPATNDGRLAAIGEITASQLTDGRDVSHATITPNGDYFTYHETDGEMSRMFVQQVGQSTRTEIVPATTKTILSKTFSPDGQYIYFVAAEKGAKVASLYRIPTLGGVQSKIIDDVGSTIAVSPDGRRIAVARNSTVTAQTEIIVANSDGTAQHTIHISRETSFIWGGLAWSPDGRSIAFGEVDMKTPGADGACSIKSLEIATGSVQPLSPDGWDRCGRMEYTHDGRGIVFVGTRKGDGLTTRRDQLFHVSLQNGEARRLTTNGHRHEVSSLGVTRAGAILIVPLNRSSQLWTMDANGKSASAVQITNGQGDGRAGIAPLPNGRIGYSARSQDSINIWVANEDGSDARQIIAEPSQTEELRASPDGRSFYFSSRVDGKARLFRSATDGSGVTLAIDDETFDVDSSISPDGNWIAYNAIVTEGTQVRHILKKASTGGGEPLRFTTEEGSNPHFSPDGRYISFVKLSKIGVLDASTGASVATFETEKHAVLNVGARWMPDGKSVTYIVRVGSASNIWRQPLDGSRPSQLTDFTSGDIYNFAFSADGKRLILARGYPTQNALLLTFSRP